MEKLISNQTANHYSWGQNCSAHQLVSHAELTVKHERMPAGSSEMPHFHTKARQFFFVLSGEATVEIAGERQTLHKHEGVEVAPQRTHHIVNNSPAEVEFLVISQPSADSDRTTILDNVQLRIATAEDAPQIRSVLHASFLEYEDRYTDRAFAATVPTEVELTDRLREGPTWVALCGGRIAGTVSAVPQSQSLHVRSMAVLPRARGKKIGTYLLKGVEDFASVHGYKRLSLSTTPFLIQAIRLYERYGFQRTNEGPSDLFGTPLFSMAKHVPSASASRA